MLPVNYYNLLIEVIWCESVLDRQLFYLIYIIFNPVK